MILTSVERYSQSLALVPLKASMRLSDVKLPRIIDTVERFACFTNDLMLEVFAFLG